MLFEFVLVVESLSHKHRISFIYRSTRTLPFITAHSSLAMRHASPVVDPSRIRAESGACTVIKYLITMRCCLLLAA